MRKVISVIVICLAVVACGGETAVSIPTSPPAATEDRQPEETAVPTPEPTETRPVEETAVATPTPQPPTIEATVALETAVMQIPLEGPIANANAEISGMAWYGDTLILMPQYPDFDGTDGAIYGIPKADIYHFMIGTNTEPIIPIRIPFESNGLGSQMAGFEGYESIAFVGETAYLTIEASGGGMKGFLAQGIIAPDLSQFSIVGDRMTIIEQVVTLGNRSDEAILVVDDQIVTFYESNGLSVNDSPVVHLFDLNKTATGTAVFPHIPYRITDVTEVDENGRFWAINYNFPGDRAIQEEDSLIANYQEGQTHLNSDGVERLIELQYTPNGITLIDRPPIQLQLRDDGELRNWEGLVRYDDLGFLIATDKFPSTILGFVPFSE